MERLCIFYVKLQALEMADSQRKKQRVKQNQTNQCNFSVSLRRLEQELVDSRCVLNSNSRVALRCNISNKLASTTKPKVMLFNKR